MSVTGSQRAQWEPARQALRANDGGLHARLLRLRDTAGRSPEVSALRVLDVATVDGRRPRSGVHPDAGVDAP